MEKTQEKLTLEINKTVNASREKVFKAWLDADMLKKFMLPKEGMTVPRAAVDARVGGKYEIVMKVKAGDEEMLHHGEYKIIQKFDIIEFTWNSPFSQGDSVVRLNFKELISAKTEVTLYHQGFESEESRDNHKGGWSQILAALLALA